MKLIYFHQCQCLDSKAYCPNFWCHPERQTISKALHYLRVFLMLVIWCNRSVKQWFQGLLDFVGKLVVVRVPTFPVTTLARIASICSWISFYLSYLLEVIPQFQCSIGWYYLSDCRLVSWLPVIDHFFTGWGLRTWNFLDHYHHHHMLLTSIVDFTKNSDWNFN